MIKFFNKKIAKLYIVLLCITLVVGIVSTCLCISYSAKFDEATKPTSSSQASDVLSTVVSALAGDENATDSLTGMLASAISSKLTGDTEETETKLSEEAQALKTKKIITLVILIVSYVLTAGFFAATITCYEYEKYLESPKYKAKLKRMKKVEKLKAEQKEQISKSTF